MLTISTTLFLAVLGCALIARRLYLQRSSHQPGSDDLWARQEFAAQRQAWEHLQRLERAERKRRR